MAETKNTSGPVQPQGVGEDPLLFYTRTFVRFLQVVFSTFPKGDYRWDPDFELTDLVIGDQGMGNNEVVEKRPAIVCIRGVTQWSNVAMDQLRDLDLASATRTHTDLAVSSMTYNCISREGLEAQRLANIAAYATRVLKRSLLRVPGMHRVGDNLSFGPETPGPQIMKDLEEHFVIVQVAVPFVFQDTYSVSPVDNLLLKELDLRVTSQTISPAQGAPPLRSPALGGKLLRFDRTVSLTDRVTTKVTQKTKK